MGKKICLVSNTSWSFTRFRRELIKALIADGHEVLLLAPEDEQTPELVAWGARVIALEKLARKGLNPISDIRLYYEFKSIYKQERPDLIFQYTIKPNVYSTLAAATCCIPAIAVVTGLGYSFINGGVITAVVRKLYRLALRKANQVWFLNKDDQKMFVESGLVEQGRTKRIPGEGVDCHGRFNPFLSSTIDSEEGARTNFLFVGRLLVDKGLREYVAAATHIRQRHPKIIFGILGYLNADNPAAVGKAELMTWVESGAVEYFGHTDDVRPYILKADCVVLPSYREGMSTILQEAASLGRPIICSDIVGCRELVEHNESGFLCKAKDVADLERQMENFLKLSNEQRNLMGGKGRNKMLGEFSVDKIIELYRKEITLIVGKS